MARDRDNANLETALTEHAAGLAKETARIAGDAALAANMTATNPIVRLRDVTTSYAANQVNLSISGIDWAAYAEVLLYVRLKTDLTSGGSMTMTLDGNASSGSYYVASYNGYDFRAFLQTAPCNSVKTNA